MHSFHHSLSFSLLRKRKAATPSQNFRSDNERAITSERLARTTFFLFFKKGHACVFGVFRRAFAGFHTIISLAHDYFSFSLHIIFVLLCFLMRFNSRQANMYFKLAINHQINTVFYLHRDATTDLSIRFTTNFFNPSYATTRLLLNLSSQRRLYPL